MKVIKHGQNYIRYGKCSCGCEFEYDRKDIKAYKKEWRADGFGIGMVEIDVKVKEKDQNGIYFYVTCPECGNRVGIESKLLVDGE